MKIGSQASAMSREPQKARVAVKDDGTAGFLAALSALLPIPMAPPPVAPPATTSADAADEDGEGDKAAGVSGAKTADASDAAHDGAATIGAVRDLLGVEVADATPPAAAAPNATANANPNAAAVANAQMMMPAADFAIQAATSAIATMATPSPRARNEAATPAPTPTPHTADFANVQLAVQGSAPASSASTTSTAAATPIVHAAPVAAAAALDAIDQPAAPAAMHARAAITVGDGADRVALTIVASGRHVRVDASAPTALAAAMQTSGDELRDALRHHGLTLSELTAGTSDGAPPRDPEPHDDTPTVRAVDPKHPNREDDAPASAGGRVLV